MEGTTSKPRAVATRPAVLDDPDPGRTAPDEPLRTDIVITAHARHLTATAVDLEGPVSLRLHHDSTRISILGTLAELDDLVAEITAEVDRIHRQRADAADRADGTVADAEAFSDGCFRIEAVDNGWLVREAWGFAGHSIDLLARPVAFSTLDDAREHIAATRPGHDTAYHRLDADERAARANQHHAVR
jgi:hypothetical protein